MKRACEALKRGLFGMLRWENKGRLEGCSERKGTKFSCAECRACVQSQRHEAKGRPEPGGWPAENLDFTQQAVGRPESG